MKKHIILMVLAYLVASSSMVLASKVVMRVYPDRKITAQEPGLPECEFVHATLEGFGRHTVNMQQTQDYSFVLEGVGAMNVAFAFQQGKINWYPLVIHQSVNCDITDQDTLEIRICSQTDSKGKRVKLAQEELKHLLHYLKGGLTGYRADCMQFASWIKYGKPLSFRMALRLVGMVLWLKMPCCRTEPDDEGILIPDDIHAGAVISFFDKYNVEQHTGWALSDDLCLSKMGDAGPLTVATIWELCRIYRCRYVEVLMQ